MKRDIIVLIYFLILFISISLLVNIGKEVSLPGFRTFDTGSHMNHVSVMFTFTLYLRSAKRFHNK